MRCSRHEKSGVFLGSPGIFLEAPEWTEYDLLF